MIYSPSSISYEVTVSRISVLVSAGRQMRHSCQLDVRGEKEEAKSLFKLTFDWV